jgi:hypothetical protein
MLTLKEMDLGVDAFVLAMMFAVLLLAGAFMPQVPTAVSATGNGIHKAIKARMDASVSPNVIKIAGNSRTGA